MLQQLTRALAVAGLAAVLAQPAFAQAGGSIKGTVTSADGKAPLAGARVSVDNPFRVATTDDRGEYALRDLQAGSYEVVVTAVGRQPARSMVTVKAGEAARANVSLAQGSMLLSSVVVSASSTPVEASKVAATINVLTQEQVRTTPARETQDMLREVPGIELPRTSSQVGGTAQIVSIRGVDEGRTAVLLDGIPLNDAWGEWIDWNRAPKGTVDRVEVLEGGGANLYGNGAMGGVISLFSRPIVPGAYRLSMDGGSRDAKHAFGTIGLPAGSMASLSLTGDYGEGGGYKLIPGAGSGPIDTVSSSIRRNFISRLEVTPAAGTSAFATWHLFSDDRKLGTPLSRAGRSDGAVDAGVNSALAEGTASVRIWDREMREDQYSTTVSTVNGVARALERTTAWAHIPSYDRGISLAWRRSNAWGFQSVGIGADYRYMGGFYDEQDYANNAANAATTHFNSGGNQALSGAFATGTLAPMDNLLVDLSARFDSWGNNDGVATDASGTTHFANATRSAFSPRIGAKYRITSSFAVHTAVYRAFRAPNLAELYRKSASATTVSLPNPNLQPETADGAEVGLDWEAARWIQVKGTVYATHYKDFNTFVTTSAAGVTPATRQRQNVQASNGTGAELYIAIRPMDGLTIGLTGEYDDARVADLGPVPATATVFKGARIGRVPFSHAISRVSYDNAMLGTWTVLGRYEGTNTTLGNTFTMQDFGVVDLNGTRNIMRGLDAFVSVENLFDRKYQVNLSGSTAAPLVTLGMPLTVRLGFDAYRW